MRISEFSDQELEEELQRRRRDECDAAAREELEARKHRFWLLIQNRDALLGLIPHDRSSCDDANPINGFGSADYGARCSRCALLELDVFGTDYEDYDFDLRLEFKRIRSPG